MAGGTPYVGSDTAESRVARLPTRAVPRRCILLVASLLAAWAAHAAPSSATAPAAQPGNEESTETPAAARPDRGEEARRAVDRIFDDPMTGVVVNRTVTIVGKDFYQHFSTRWRQNPEAAKYSISIYERPSARFGSEIWVEYRQQRMFHTFLPPARAATRPISEAAIEIVLRNVTRREVERRTTWNPDMGPEEL